MTTNNGYAPRTLQALEDGMRHLFSFKKRNMEGRWMTKADTPTHSSDYVNLLLEQDFARWKDMYGIFYANDTLVAWKPHLRAPWRTPQALYSKRELEVYMIVRKRAYALELEYSLSRDPSKVPPIRN